MQRRRPSRAAHRRTHSGSPLRYVACTVVIGVGAGACGHRADIARPPLLVVVDGAAREWPTRPTVVGCTAIDYATLPRLTSIEVGSNAMFDTCKPNNRVLAPGIGRLNDGSPLLGHLDSNERWLEFFSNRTADGIDLVRYRAITSTNCLVRPIEGWRVRATALAQGALYAFRSSPPLPRPDEQAPVYSTRGENLEILGPSAFWVSSTSGTERDGFLQRFADTEQDDAEKEKVFGPHASFEHVVIRVDRGADAAAVLDISTLSLDAFLHESTPEDSLGAWLAREEAAPPTTPSNVTALSLTVDVTWPSEERAPTAFAFASTLLGRKKEMLVIGPAEQPGQRFAR